MSQNWGMGFLPCIVLSCAALCFNGGWLLAIVIWVIYLYSGVTGEMKNEQEKAYRKMQEEIYHNTMKYSLKDFERQLILGQFMVEFMETDMYSPSHCKMMAESIVLRYCPIYLSTCCLELEKQFPAATTMTIRELGLQIVKEKYLEDCRKTNRVMFSPETPYGGDSELKENRKEG